MFEHLGRRVVLIVVLLLVSLALLLQPEPFRLGLDLAGGTRIVYRFNFDEARARGDIGADEDTGEILSQTLVILRSRVDPTGTLDPVIRTEGTNRVVFELPGNVGAGQVSASSTLAAALDPTRSDFLELADGQAFPLTGVVRIDQEQIRYEGREQNRLFNLRRAYYGTSPRQHESGAAVELVNADAIRAAIENLGELAFRLIAEPRDLTELGTDFGAEQQKLENWRAANPGTPIVAFNSVPPELGGPSPVLRWYPDKETEAGGARAVLQPRTPQEDIRGEDLSRVYYTSDAQGFPAVGFEIRAGRVDDFADFTGDNKGRFMAIVLNDEIRSAPRLEEKLIGGGIIRGRFTADEVKNLVTVLRSGSLKLKPTLENDERVSATLGEDYVQRGYQSGILAIVIVVAFMVVYYRRLGVFAGLALLTNLIMFLGGLAFFHATLTLPGIAGIVLTVGMAVDANILIFDRIREEAEKGRNPKQAAKAGFDKALSAIVDANVTTFLTAVILFWLGTGPVRGFAVTLMIGIVTSVFAALVTTRVFVEWALSRGTQGFRMGRWMADAKFDFLGKARVFLSASALVCLGGLALFLATPDSERLGIDFTGGVEAHLVTAQPQEIDTMRRRVAAIPGIGESAEVKSVLNSAAGDDTYTQFRVTFKTLSEETQVGQGEELKPQLEAELGDLLLADPVQVTLSGEPQSPRAEIALFFQDLPELGEIKGKLEELGLKDVTVAVGERRGAFTATAGVAPGRDKAELRGAIHDALGAVHKLQDPIQDWSQVGPQVVGELRDKALLALLASLFVTVIYIRVRFAEYSYGLAAIVALVHDVLITLAALTIGNRLGIVNGEINLAMIAVFLTIIGYSVNDTIVIFDRVRENLPRMKAPLREVLNISVNETLSRTIMTSLTVFLAILVQYLFNMRTGNVLESISFAMLFGTLSGVYSTVFIANPVFLWLETRSARKRASGGAQARALREAERKEHGGGDDELLTQNP